MVESGAAVLLIVAAALSAYTGGFQQTTISLSTRARDLMPPEVRQQGGATIFQGALTPQAQNNRNVAQFILIPATIAYGWYFYGWAGALGLALGGLVLRSILAAFVMPKPGSKHYMAAIVSNLQQRRSQFERAGDYERVKAADMTLSALEDLESGLSELDWFANLKARHGEQGDDVSTLSEGQVLSLMLKSLKKLDTMSFLTGTKAQYKSNHRWIVQWWGGEFEVDEEKSTVLPLNQEGRDLLAQLEEPPTRQGQDRAATQTTALTTPITEINPEPAPALEEIEALLARLNLDPSRADTPAETLASVVNAFVEYKKVRLQDQQDDVLGGLYKLSMVFDVLAEYVSNQEQQALLLSLAKRLHAYVDSLLRLDEINFEEKASALIAILQAGMVLLLEPGQRPIPSLEEIVAQAKAGLRPALAPSECQSFLAKRFHSVH